MTSSTIAQPCDRRLRDRLIALWPLKLFGGLAISAGFFCGYFLLQHVRVFPLHVMPASRLDRWIGFHPDFAWVYVSLWLYMSIVPWLMCNREELLMFARSLGAICLAGLLIFAIWPTAVARPTPAATDSALFRSLVRYDGTANACPSLHVTFAIFSALCIGEAVPRIDAGWMMRVGSWCWCAAIVYATLATKEHVVVDVLAGIPCGIGAWLLHRHARNTAAV